MLSSVRREIKLIRGLSRMAMLIETQLINWHQGQPGVRQWQIGNENKGPSLWENTITRSHQCEPARGEMLTHGELTWELQHQHSATCCLSQAP